MDRCWVRRDGLKRVLASYLVKRKLEIHMANLIYHAR